MANDEELSDRLRRMGVVKGARHLKPAPPAKPSPAEPSSAAPGIPYPGAEMLAGDIPSLASLLPGSRLQITELGDCLILDHAYPLAHEHGNEALQALFQFQPAQAELIVNDPRLRELDFRHFLFLDTETTGLAGAGTIAFMVGALFFEDDAVVARQYFVPDFGDEGAMLQLLAELLTDKQGLVTFNGRSFDVPLLANRYLMNRMSSELDSRPHLDLLLPARRLWRSRLGSVALSALEPALLGVQRTHEDVPGWLIPSLYRHYIQTGDGRELARVFYHNRLDLLSMVTLTTHVLRLFNQAGAADNPLDLYSLGRWQAKLGLAEAAERNLKLAAQGDLSLVHYHRNLFELGALLKRSGRRQEALTVWQQIAATTFDEVEAHVELAKHFEWQERRLELAREWTQQALTLVSGWQPPARAAAIRESLQHRLARLERKIDHDQS